ncbi:PREDICTED: MLP-like protein 328 [Camelina sativa]|uniref:MLP-like protein 328 n=1 Tax=Camelina sativa TaxID=90675 RepID=A0ABM1RP19_CAMSA|nr:PREDICTED: MLP-like protein 328 [Camelina sativa]
MATSGTYVTEVPLKGSADQYYKSWKSENHLFPDAIGQHIQHPTCMSLFTKPVTFKERREIDDANKTLTKRGLEGHPMEDLKVFDVVYQFIPKSEDSCVCKITMMWEKRNDDFPEPSGLMKFVKTMVVDIEGHVTKA